jgi:adenylosuccinate lyase
VKNTFFANGNGNGHSNGKDDAKAIFRENLRKLVDQFGITSEDVKNLSIAALLMQMSKLADDKESKGLLNQLMQMAKKKGVSDDAAQTLGIW